MADMTPQEMQEFQKNLLDEFGRTYRIKVDRVLNAEEIEELTAWVRFENNDPNASVLIEQPIAKPSFSFNYEVLEPVEEVEEVEPVEEVKPKRYAPYGAHLVVMQNPLLQAITDLSKNERRLIMFLSTKVRAIVDKNPRERKFDIVALEFAEMFGKGNKSIYRSLEEIADSLLNKSFFFWNFSDDGLANKKGVSWVAECEYKQGKGLLEITLTDSVTEMLTVFDKEHPYTKYEIEYIANLSMYGIILYELISYCVFQKEKHKKFTVEYLRQKFNCTDKYEKITDFKAQVIDKAIKDIEKHTPLRISYHQGKTGRIVDKIIFKFHVKNQISSKEKPEIDYKFKPLTESQLNKFVPLLANNSTFISSADGFPAKAGDDMPVYQNKLRQALKNTDNIKKWKSYLEKEGFVFK